MLLSMLGVNLSAGHDGVVSVHVLRLKPWIDGKIHWTVMFFFVDVFGWAKIADQTSKLLELFLKILDFDDL